LNIRQKKIVSIVAILAIGLFLSWMVVVLKPSPAPQPPAPQKPHPADVVVVETVTAPIVVNSQGTVTPKTEIDVTAQVSGQVVSVSDRFAAGGFFAAGESLLQIDPRDYEVKLIQAQSRLMEARKVLAMEKGQALQAKREWRDLGNDAANALSLRKPQLAAAEAALQGAEADVRQAKLDLERTTISLPFSGRVARTEVNLGQYLTSGKVIGRVFATDIMEVRLPLSAHQMRLLNLKADSDSITPLDVTLRFGIDNDTYRWKGQVVRAEPQADINNRMYYVVAEIRHAYDYSDPDHPPLVAGTFIEADISSNPYQDVAVLPRDALYQRDKVMVLDENRRLQLVAVEVLQVSSEQLVVKGLEEGALVLAKPPGFMEIGAAYEPIIAAQGEQG